MDIYSTFGDFPIKENWLYVGFMMLLFRFHLVVGVLVLFGVFGTEKDAVDEEEQ